MKVARLGFASLVDALALNAGSARAVDMDYDGLSTDLEFNLGMNDNDRDSNANGLIDGLEFGKTACTIASAAKPN
jgi:hypothetical protein